MCNTIEYSNATKGSVQCDEIRDVPKSHYVCQWWIQKFQDIKIENNSNDSIQFKKKHRDHIRWKKAKIPFRRSGLWLTMKVVFQMILSKRLADDGTLIYKLLITHFLTYVICQTYSTISVDLLIHCIRKIVRRLNKIENMLSHTLPSDINEWMQSMKLNIRRKIEQLLPKSDWQKFIKSNEGTNRKLLMTKFEFLKGDIYQHSC
ncbi:unnamed protein product, partial [Rotaria sp. Silwood2]